MGCSNQFHELCMLHLIVTGRAAELGRYRVAALSVAAHVGLVVAVISSRPSLPGRSAGGLVALPPLERVRYLVVAPVPAPAPKKETPAPPVKARRAAPARSPIGNVPALTLSIPTTDLDSATGIDKLNVTQTVSDTADFRPRTLADAIGASLFSRHAAAPPPVDGVYRADAVDRVVTPLDDNPRPAYPRSLQSQGVEADFTVLFVVDSTGRVDPRTLEVPGSVHRLFADAVRYALSRSRYLPAQIAGRPVRQLVSQEFVFRMAR
jgi:TonB family protein